MVCAHPGEWNYNFTRTKASQVTIKQANHDSFTTSKLCKQKPPFLYHSPLEYLQSLTKPQSCIKTLMNTRCQCCGRVKAECVWSCGLSGKANKTLPRWPMLKGGTVQHYLTQPHTIYSICQVGVKKLFLTWRRTKMHLFGTTFVRGLTMIVLHGLAVLCTLDPFNRHL